MIFIKNKREWNKWAKEFNKSQPQAPADPHDKFPCFLYLTVGSYGYEEEREKYLYKEDIEKMLQQFKP